jgi:small subunit ribosomal protein S20
MPHSLSAKKRVRQTEKRALANRSKSSAMKTAIRRVEEAAAEGDEAKLNAAVVTAYSRIDKAAKANIIHANTAARRKSLVMRKASGPTA